LSVRRRRPQSESSHAEGKRSDGLMGGGRSGACNPEVPSPASLLTTRAKKKLEGGGAIQTHRFIKCVGRTHRRLSRKEPALSSVLCRSARPCSSTGQAGIGVRPVGPPETTGRLLHTPHIPRRPPASPSAVSAAAREHPACASTNLGQALKTGKISPLDLPSTRYTKAP